MLHCIGILGVWVVTRLMNFSDRQSGNSTLDGFDEEDPVALAESSEGESDADAGWEIERQVPVFGAGIADFLAVDDSEFARREE